MKSSPETWDVKLLDLIHGDVEDARVWLKGKDTQSHRRAFIRAVFAAIEGTLYIMRTDVLKSIQKGEYPQPVGDVSLLNEESYSLDQQRLKANVSPRFIPLSVMLRYTIKHFTQVHGIEFNIDTMKPGWQAFLRAIDTRNRITHPKKPDQFLVSDPSLRDTQTAYKWFFTIYGAIHESILKDLKVQEEQLKVQLGGLRKEINPEPPGMSRVRP